MRTLPERQVRRFARLLGVCLLAGMAPAEARSPEASTDTTPLEHVLEAVDARSAVVDAAVVERVVGLGSEALPMWFEVLASGGITTSDGEHAPLSSAHERCVEQAFLALPPEVVFERTEDRVRSDAPRAVRGFVLDLYREIGTGPSVRYVASLASEDLASSFESTLGAILVRDARGFGYLDGVSRTLPRDLLPALVRAVGSSESPSGLLPILRLLGTDAELDVLVLEQMTRLGDPSAAPRSMIGQVRSYLDRSEDELLRAAQGALAFLDDHQSVGRMIAFLGDDRLTVRRGAHDALVEMTGLRFKLDERRWECWYAGEVTWWEERSEQVFADLRDPDPAVVLQGVGELVGRRLNRGELAEELLVLLRDGDADIRRIACYALGQVGAKSAISPLRDRLDDQDEAVRESAADALRNLGWSLQ